MRLSREIEKLNQHFPVKHAAVTLQVGALMMAGVTAETDLGVAIVATSAGADVIGVLKEQFASTSTDTAVAGTTWTRKAIEVAVPMFVLDSDYDLADTAAVASTSSTTVTITSLEDNIDTSYLYAVSGTGAYQINFLATSASGSCVTKTATGWDSTTTVVKVLRIFHQLVKLNTAATKIGTDAAAGSYTALVLNNYVIRAGKRFMLDPVLHSGLTFDAATRIVAQIGVRNAGPYTTE